MLETTITDRPEARRVRWSAIFAGALTAIAIQFALAVLGMGIGASVAQPGGADASKLGMGAAIYWLVTGLVALFCGGWVAGRLSGDARRLDTALHGFLTWALATLVMAALLTTAVGGVVGGAMHLVAKGAQGAGGAIGKAAGAMSGSSAGGEAGSDQSWSRLSEQVDRTLRGTDRPAIQPDALRDAAHRAGDQARAAGNGQPDDQRLVDSLRDAVTRGKQALSATDRDAVVNALAARSGMPREQAEQTLDRWTEAYERDKDQAKQTATEAARTAASATATAAWWSFAALVVGAAVAIGGGSLAFRRDDARPIAHA